MRGIVRISHTPLSVYSIPPLITVITFAAFAIYVFRQRRRIQGNILAYSLWCLLTCYWQFTWTLLFSTQDPLWAALWVRVGYTGIAFIPVAFYHASISLLQSEPDQAALPSIYIIAAFFSLSSWIDGWFVNGFYHYAWGYYPKAGPLHPVFLIFLSAICVRFFSLWWKASRAVEVSGHHLRQTRLVFTAIAVYVLAASDFIVNYGVDFYPLGFVFTLAALALISIAVTRFRLDYWKREVAGVLAHEIKSPLSGLALPAELTMMDLEDLLEGRMTLQQAGPRMLRRLKFIQQQVQLAGQRLEAVHGAVQRERREQRLLEWRPFIERVLETQRAMLEKEAIATLAEFPKESLRVLASESQLEIVLVNLIKNALEAMAAVSDKKSIRLKTEKAGSSLCLTVADSGPGVPSDRRERLFDPFQSTKPGANRGMGLYLSKEIIQDHGGTLKLAETTTPGAVFELRLPLAGN
jgi:two-component system CAI-1 autoinducer sensor kinase/phosphatase CqsS